MLNKTRLEFLTDGVIAIVLTMMVLEIKLPVRNNHINWLDFGTHILIYALSFAVIAIVWYNLYHLFTNVKHTSHKFTWLNLALLFCISLIPLPTAQIGEHFFEPDYHLAYGLILGLNSILFSLIQHHIHNDAEHLAKTKKKQLNLKNWITVVVYFSAGAISYFSVYLSMLIYILIPIVFFLPSKEIIKNEAD